MQLIDLVSIVLVAMSLPLSLLVYLRFADSRYGRVISWTTLFIFFVLIYSGFRIYDLNLYGISMAELTGVLACSTIFYTSLLMLKMFVPGGVR
ncbi:MAG: hypothetical protein NTU61_00295 [Candidatus Altiarchaeota archaeon]|nr:hypothetical protein [Candidatus Altiarchaeota archaeon]